MNVNSRVKSTQGCRIKFGEASAYDDEGNQGRFLRGVEFGGAGGARARLTAAERSGRSVCRACGGGQAGAQIAFCGLTRREDGTHLDHPFAQEIPRRVPN